MKKKNHQAPTGKLAEQYKARRIELGYTQAQLAELLGINRNTITKREAGAPGYPIGREAWLAISALPPAPPTGGSPKRL
jgi:DNA-binding XRE family transcriptional regulator